MENLLPFTKDLFGLYNYYCIAPYLSTIHLDSKTWNMLKHFKRLVSTKYKIEGPRIGLGGHLFYFRTESDIKLIDILNLIPRRIIEKINLGPPVHEYIFPMK